MNIATDACYESNKNERSQNIGNECDVLFRVAIQHHRVTGAG
jgi:hypothetical protein